ncbi:MAG: hypothetical protein ACRCZN_07985 [Lactococcus lactis]
MVVTSWISCTNKKGFIMDNFYYVFEIDEEIIERPEPTEEQIHNLEIVFNKLTSNEKISRVLFQIPTYDRENTEHILFECSDRILGLSLEKETLDNEAKKFAEALRISELVKDCSVRKESIKKGLLFIKFSSATLYLLKLEKLEGIDLNTYEIETNIITEKNYYKVCIFKKNEFENIVIMDKSKSPAKYWTEQFLRIERKRDNVVNTQELLNNLENENLFNKSAEVEENDLMSIKKQFRNLILSSQNFDIDDYCDKISIPEKYAFSMHDIINKEIFDNIDTDFDLDWETVQKKYQKEWKLTERITIKTKNIVSDIKAEVIRVDPEAHELTIIIDDSQIKNVEKIINEYKL